MILVKNLLRTHHLVFFISLLQYKMLLLRVELSFVYVDTF